EENGLVLGVGDNGHFVLFYRSELEELCLSVTCSQSMENCQRKTGSIGTLVSAYLVQSSMEIINQKRRIPPLLLHHSNSPSDPLPHALDLGPRRRLDPLHLVLVLEALDVEGHAPEGLELLGGEVG